MSEKSKPEPTKRILRAHLFARLAGWLFLGAIFASMMHIGSGPIADYTAVIFFTLSVISLFIITPILLINGSPKGSADYKIGIAALAIGILALAILGFYIAQRVS